MSLPLPLRRTTAAAIASIAVHAAVFVVSAVTVARRFAEPPAAASAIAFPLPSEEDVIVVELPPASGDVVVEASSEPRVEPPKIEPPANGGATLARVDTGRAGRGGDEDTQAKARNLAPRVEEDTVTPLLRDDFDGEQEKRLATGAERRGFVDRRRAAQPMQLTFVASGRGFRYERRAPAARDATAGVPSEVRPTPLGGRLGAGAAFVDGPGAPIGGAHAGGAIPRPLQGAADGRRTTGEPQLVGSPIALARPHVDRGNPSVASDDRGRSGDRRDADLAVADARRSLVATSTAGGGKLGDGRGGSAGGGAPAAGGHDGAGSVGANAGTIEGPAAYAARLRKTRYVMDLYARLGPLFEDVFPHDAYAQLRNGTLYVEITIGKDGSVQQVIVTRPSGVAGFDENVVAAIRGAGAFEPLPDVYGAGPASFQYTVTGGFAPN